MVELVDAMEGQRTALTQTGVYIQFALTLQFADPFWYEPENIRAFNDQEDGVLFNPGTVASRNGIIRIDGPAEDPELSLEPAETRLQFNGSIPYGEFIEINSDEFTAIDQDGNSVAGSLERDQINLIEIFPGRNVVQLSDGTAEIRWRPAFL
jgi:phage-related protein